MHRFLFILLIAFAAAFVSAQEVIVSGRIVDLEEQQAMPYASISVRNIDDSTLVAGAISGEDGRFTLRGLEEGEYTLMVSFLGYHPGELHLLIGELNDVYDLGKIELVQSPEVLTEVTVTGEQQLVSVNLDKRTYQMDDNLAQAGGSVLDALKSLPGVTVDAGGKVILRGSDKVAVLIDGKQSSITGFGNQKGLDNIPVSNIERIEIIHNPSVRYDAYGMAGIINIVYKKEKETGFHGDAGFTFGLGTLTPVKEDLPTELGSFRRNPKYIPGLNLNYRTQKVNVFFQSEFIYQYNLPNNEFTTRIYDDGKRTASQVPENRKQIRYILNGGIDYTINDNNLLTFSAAYDYEHHYDSAQVPYFDMDTWSRYRYWNWLESEATGYMNFRLDYEHMFEEPGHKLSASAYYTKGWEDETYHLNDSSDIRQSRDKTHILATEHTASLSVDYVKPMRNGRLEAGTKLQLRRIPVTYIVDTGQQTVIYPGLGEWSDWGEDIYAGYLNYVLERTRFNVEAGLRAEQTMVFYDIDPVNIYYDQNDAYHYFSLFPSVRLGYKFNDRNRLSVFYNRRVDRPGEPELRIFPKYDDPELLKVGNPYLRPQFTQTVELAFRNKWESGSITMAGFYRLIKDPYTRVYGIDDRDPEYDIVNKIYQNTGSGTNLGTEIIFSQDIGEFWELGLSLNAYQNVIDQYSGILLFPYERPFTIERTVDNTWDTKINNQFSLPAGIQLQITFLYYAPKNIPQGKQLARSSFDIGLKKKILGDKGEVNLSFSDAFNRFGIRQELRGDGFSAIYENYYETQVIRLGFRYKF